MKNFLLLTILAIAIVSCDPPDAPDPPVDPLDPVCTLDLSVVICQNFQCQQVSAFEGAFVEVFATEQDAIDGIDRIISGTTNDEGMRSLGFLPCDFIWVKIVTENRGVYLERFSLSQAASTNFEQIEFVEGLIYQNGSEGFATQSHISFDTPILGQASKYLYYNFQGITWEIDQYRPDTLTVRLVDQLDDNTYVVEEKVNSVDDLQNFFFPEIPLVKTRWIFYEDSIRVIPHSEETYGSFIWNLNKDYFLPEVEGYTFSILRPTQPIVDMDNDLTSIVEFGTSAAEDYNLLGHLFQDLIIDKRSYVGLDGPEKIIVYSNEDGIVRSMNFGSGGAMTTIGFDLLLE